MIRWVASYPKSGNTWLRLFLLAYENPQGVDINKKPAHHRQDIDPSTYQRLSPVDLEELTKDEARLLRGAVLVWLNRAAGDRPLYLKTHAANISTNSAMAWIPPELTEKAIYIVRDPRDVAVSFADHLGESIDEAIRRMGDESEQLERREKGDAIHQPLLTWSMNVQSWNRPHPYDCLMVRYEGLLQNPSMQFRAIVDFLGLDFDQEHFDTALMRTTFSHLRATEEAEGYSTKSPHQRHFFRSGKAGAWRDVLTAEQVARIEADHGETMKMCGYELETAKAA